MAQDTLLGFPAHTLPYRRGEFTTSSTGSGSMCVFAGCTAWGASLFADRPDKSHVSFLQVQAGQVRRPGLLAGQRAGALQRVRAVIVSAQRKL